MSVPKIQGHLNSPPHLKSRFRGCQGRNAFSYRENRNKLIGQGVHRQFSLDILAALENYHKSHATPTFHPNMPPTLEEDDYHDTIVVVKSEYNNWSRPSSPESMSNDIELEPQVVASLLAQINTPQHLESPEPLDEDVSTPNPRPDRPDSQFDQGPSRLPRQRHRPNVTTMEERLMMMPEKRPLPWRDGVEPGADNETGGESRRKQIRFGCLLATRGDIQEIPCNSCANGRGKFKVCVALEGYFKGACASCQLSGRPNRCSIKKNDGKS